MKQLLVALFPPDIPSLQRWRLAVFAALVLMLAHVAWACGWLVAFGLGRGFAYADQFKNVTDQVSAIKIELLEQRLFETRLRHCQSMKAGQPAVFYAEKIQELRSKYRKLTATEYSLPSCAEL